MQRWLTTKQVAEEMHASSSSVRRWITRGLKYSDIGVPGSPKIRISKEDLDAWVKNPNKAA